MPIGLSDEQRLTALILKTFCYMCAVHLVYCWATIFTATWWTVFIGELPFIDSQVLAISVIKIHDYLGYVNMSHLQDDS